MSDNISQARADRKMPRWMIGTGSAIAVALLTVMIANGSNANAGSRASLVAQVEEEAEQQASRLGCDLAKNLRVIDAQYGTIGYDQQDLVRGNALEGRAPAVHAVVGLTCMNNAAGTEDEMFQQVLVGIDVAADEPRCRGVESITRFDATSNVVTGYQVDVDASGKANSVARLRGVCDFQKS
jgi:hypothetical protein